MAVSDAKTRCGASCPSFLAVFAVLLDGDADDGCDSQHAAQWWSWRSRKLKRCGAVHKQFFWQLERSEWFILLRTLFIGAQHPVRERSYSRRGSIKLFLLFLVERRFFLAVGAVRVQTLETADSGGVQTGKARIDWRGHLRFSVSRARHENRQTRRAQKGLPVARTNAPTLISCDAAYLTDSQGEERRSTEMLTSRFTVLVLRVLLSFRSRPYAKSRF